MKILFVSYDNRNLNIGSFERFNYVGNDCVMLHLHTDINEKDLLARLRKKLRISNRYFYSKIFKENECILDKFFKEEKPDILYVYRGSQFSSETINRYSKKCITVLHLTDSIQRYQEWLCCAKEYDYVFTFEKTDVDFLREKGIKSLFIPGSSNCCSFYNLHINKTIDVSFLGSMYRERRILLERLATDLKDYNLVFVGKYANIKNPIVFLKYIFNKRIRKAFVNKNISASEANVLYNKSHIVINMIHEQSKCGWNGKMIDIIFSGAFQIVNSNLLIKEEFGSKIVCFENYNDLLEKIKYFLEHEKEADSIKKSAYEYAISRFDDRILFSKIINVIQGDNSQ